MHKSGNLGSRMIEIKFQKSQMIPKFQCSVVSKELWRKR